MSVWTKQGLYSFLRWIEKYTKIDMFYLARGGFWAVFGQISASIISLGLAIFIARYVPKDVYGNYKFILAIIATMATFSLSGIGAAVFQSVARGYRSALEDGFRANLQWSIFVFLGALAGGGYYLFHGNTTIGIGILLGGCLTPFLSGYNLYLSLLLGEKDFRAAAWYGDFVTNIVPALVLITVAYFAPQPLFLVAAYFIANTLATAYAYYRVKQKYPDTSGTHDSGMLSYGKHLSFLGIIGGIVGNLDQLLLFHFVGPVELAIYNFAIGIPDQLKGPMKNLDSMTQARFVKHNSTNIRKNMRTKTLLLFAFSVFVIAAYISLAPYLFTFLFPQYLDAVPYTQVYILSYLSLMFSPGGSYLSSKKLIKEIYINNLVSYALQIVGITIGVIGWGLWGLVWAIVLIRFAAGLCGYTLYLIASGRETTA